MTTWLYEVGITMSCKTTLNIPSYYSYLKLAKLPVYLVLLEILTLVHTAMWSCEANDYMAFNHEVYLAVLLRKVVMALISDQRVV